MKLRDKLWVWGQDAGSHHNTTQGNIWKLEGENKLGPVDGAEYLGIPNCCRVVMNGKPMPPFDDEADKLDSFNNVIWSIIGDGGSVRNNDETDLEEIVRIAAEHTNVCGAIMDDFMNEKRLAIFTPEKLHEMRDRLHTAIPGRELKLWNVVYCNEFADKLKDWFDEIDGATIWEWYSEEILKLEENYKYLKGLIGEDKPVMAGCYLYDYGNCCPMPMDLMKLQLDTFYKWLKEGYIQGIVFCSNCVADIGLEAADYAKAWIAEHGDEEID